MKNYVSKYDVSKAVAIAIALISFLFICLRFIHLTADFPLGVTWSGVVYSDEGFYANAAVRHLLFGEWYLAGDFNPAINMPIGQILHRLMFGVFGLSLFSARITEATAFSAVIVFAALIVRRGSGIQAGLLTALILATNFVGFAFSRLAIMEPVGMLFVTIALFVAQQARGERALVLSIVSSVLVGAAALVKGSMIFAIPLVTYFIWLNGQDLRKRVVFAALSLFVSFLIVGGSQAVAKQFYSADFAHFVKVNWEHRAVTGIQSWLFNIAFQAKGMLQLGKPLLILSTLLVTSAGVLSERFRRSPMVHVLCAYAFFCFGLLTIVHYNPPRYFLPLLIPLAGLSAIACVELTNWLRETLRYSKLAVLPSLLIAGIVFLDGAKISAYIISPKYSFTEMAASVGEIIYRREGRLSGVTLLGNIADSVSLETGVRTINTEFGTLPLPARIEKYHPLYGIILTEDEKKKVIGAIRSIGGHLTELGAWEVYRNYYSGQNVKLYSIE